MKVAVVIPFRDRGIDPLRRANLDCVLTQWHDNWGCRWGVFDDGRDGRDQFNRSAAYNRGVAAFPHAEVYVFAEADMLIGMPQVEAALIDAVNQPGLVVPFDQYGYLSERDSARVRKGADPATFTPLWKMTGGRSIGAINVLSRASVEAIGQFDEGFEGSWYDDDAVKVALEACAGPTRCLSGPAWHLYHLPGHRGSHLSAQDRAATARNKERLGRYLNARVAVDAQERIRELTSGRD